MKRLKAMLSTVCILLMMVSVATLFMSLQQMSAVRPASDYTDKGVHTFVPWTIYSTPKYPKSSGHQKNRRAATLIYVVEYRASDGTGYRYRYRGGTARSLAQKVYDQGPVDRRVLLIEKESANITYITVEADETAESYTKGRMVQLQIRVSLAGAYLLAYGAIRYVLWARKQDRESMV